MLHERASPLNLQGEHCYLRHWLLLRIHLKSRVRKKGKPKAESIILKACSTPRTYSTPITSKVERSSQEIRLQGLSSIEARAELSLQIWGLEDERKDKKKQRCVALRFEVARSGFGAWDCAGMGWVRVGQFGWREGREAEWKVDQASTGKSLWLRIEKKRRKSLEAKRRIFLRWVSFHGGW